MKLLLKNLLFTVLVPGTVAVWAPWYFLRAHPTSPVRVALSLPFFASALVVYSWTVTNFARIGRGTPAPLDAPKRLIVQGPHRFVRNPMYLAVLSAILGWAVSYRSVSVLLYLAVIATAFHLTVVLLEEPSLTRRFGDDYIVYCSRVRRWLPGRPHSPATSIRLVA